MGNENNSFLPAKDWIAITNRTMEKGAQNKYESSGNMFYLITFIIKD